MTAAVVAVKPCLVFYTMNHLLANFSNPVGRGTKSRTKEGE